MSKYRNVIFLDIDGVLNSMDYFTSEEYVNRYRADGFRDIDENKVILLKQLCDKSKATLILSSTWRGLIGTDHYDYLETTLAKYSLTIDSHLPKLDYNRPLEIKTWLDDHVDERIKYVSLDDDFSYEQYDVYGLGKCLVKTSFYDGGLKQSHVDLALKILL